MNEFNKLKELLDSLSKFELKFLRRNFKQFLAGDSDSNILFLFNSFLKRTEIEYEMVVVKLYGFDNKSAFKKLAQRLIDKILDSLISKDLLLNEQIHNERNRELFQIKRKFLYYDILSLHGLNNQALSTLNQIIKSAEELEYYDYLLIALNTKLVRLSRRTGIFEFSEIHKQIEFYNRCSIALNRAIFLLAHYTSMRNSGQGIAGQYNLNKEIKLIEAESTITKSIRIKSALYYLKGISFSNANQYENAKLNFYNFYSHLKRNANKNIKSNDRLNCLLNICEFEIKTFEFKKAIFYFEEIDKIKIVNKFNVDIVNEMKFLCYLSIGEIEKAKNYLGLLVKTRVEFDYSVLHNDRISYYNGVLSFINNDFSSCVRNLLAINKIDKNQSDWNLCQRILLILSFIETGKYNLADNHIENLRKYLNGKGRDSKLNSQVSLIYKILLTLAKLGFDFRRTYLEMEKTLVLVEPSPIEKYFDYRSPYLIPFVPWFKAKLKNQPYNHSAAMREMRRKYKADQLELV